MYSFEGQYKRRPVQSLRGSSLNEEKGALIQRAQEDRKQREAQRKRLQSAIQIQSFYRACKCRQHVRSLQREEFDTICQSIQKKKTADNDIHALQALCRKFIFFYKIHTDGNRLTWLSQLLVKHQSLVSMHACQESHPLCHQVKRMLFICCSYIENTASTQTQLTSPLRLIEVYTTVNTYSKHSDRAVLFVHHILQTLITRGYYSCMRMLLEQKVPPNLERTTTPPTPIAGSILELIKKPLAFLKVTDDLKFRNAVLQSLCRGFFCSQFTSQIKDFLLPALACGEDLFPFVELLQALLPFCRTSDRSTSHGSRTNGESFSSIVPDWQLTVESSPWLLCAILTLGERHLEHITPSHLSEYMLVLHKLVPSLNTQAEGDDEDDSDDEDMDVEYLYSQGSIHAIQQDCLRLLNETKHVIAILKAINKDSDSSVLSAVCTVCHTLMVYNKLSVHKSRLMYSLAFNPVFIRNLWYTCVSITTTTVTGAEVPLLQMISRGSSIDQEDINRIVPLLSMFCALFSHSLMSLHDAEFYGEDPNVKSYMPFKLHELPPMALALRDVCLGIIEIAHPDTKPDMKDDYKRAFLSMGVKIHDSAAAAALKKHRHVWAYLFKVSAHVVKQLYARDSRRSFCDYGHWLARQINIQADQPSQIYKSGANFERRPFGALSTLNPNRQAILDEEGGVPLSTKEVRNLTILQELPFVVSFQERVKILSRLLHQDKRENQGGEMRHFTGGPSINILVRRNYLYEDAHEKLSPENEPNLKLKMQVQLINFAGVDEAGIDGGGLFREFMSELLKTSFDPNRGFFKYTTDKQIYPNPNAELLTNDYRQHYFFLGRMLGKALYENMLVELPFASFFMSKILSRHRGDVDIHHLQSLDPEMYRNLLFLKTFDGDISELGLDFSVTNEHLGQVKSEDLKPGGRDIPVTNHNVIEYIHLMADYRLNRQIRSHTDAFRKGLADVVNIEWLRMFNHNELQVVISGAHVPIDIDDLRAYTNYSGGYANDHPVIQMFWQVVEEFTENQKMGLLKFVTSCSRPPLLGFKDLYPSFCIHYAGNDPDRLPTASTCMNLLKLPEFKTIDILRQKLTYAVESGAGFELS